MPFIPSFGTTLNVLPLHIAVSILLILGRGFTVTVTKKESPTQGPASSETGCT